MLVDSNCDVAWMCLAVDCGIQAGVETLLYEQYLILVYLMHCSRYSTIGWNGVYIGNIWRLSNTHILHTDVFLFHLLSLVLCLGIGLLFPMYTVLLLTMAEFT